MSRTALSCPCAVHRPPSSRHPAVVLDHICSTEEGKSLSLDTYDKKLGLALTSYWGTHTCSSPQYAENRSVLRFFSKLDISMEVSSPVASSVVPLETAPKANRMCCRQNKTAPCQGAIRVICQGADTLDINLHNETTLRVVTNLTAKATRPQRLLSAWGFLLHF